MSGGRPASTRDLLPSESRFAAAMRQLGYGRFESLRIQRGELVLDPWPSTVRNVKFGTTDPAEQRDRPAEFDLKKQVAEFFEYIREVEAGEIRALEVQGGLPFSMQVEQRPGLSGGRHHA
jgi:hypothetical protein